MKQAKQYLRKYFVMGSQDCLPNKEREGVTESEQIKRAEETFLQAAQAGITAFQFREKGKDALDGQAKLDLAKRLRAHCRTYGIPFFINDDVDLIKPLQADGVHVGQDDQSVAAIRKAYPNIEIGLSVGSRLELEQSRHLLPYIQYIGAGPVYETQSKSDAKEACGTEWIVSLKEILPEMPVVGIGGITVHNAQDVLEAGADGLAVISAITRASNIKQTVHQL
ncbi:MAG TPA: thiamine phosphate synthase [Pseudogracilibacillus sp.]|nr:thiamine phosphate synthase [Pseudogracilibacillus sp.]